MQTEYTSLSAAHSPIGQLSRGRSSEQANTRTRQNDPRVLVIGPGRRGRGGIDAVIWAYTQSSVWSRYSCRWLESYQDSGRIIKFWIALRALLLAPLAIWRSDIVHVHAAFRASILRKTPFLILAKALRKKVILHMHDYDMEYLQRKGHGVYARMVLRQANCVVALSPLWADVYRRAGIHFVEIIPNPVIIPASKNACAGSTILYMGKLEGRKGYEDLLRAMPLVIQRFKDARLQFAGTGEIDRAKRLANELGIATSVDFLGWIKKEDRSGVYGSADVFCLPSYNEGLPMVVLEAMAHALPVVCTPVGGLPDLIQSGTNGIFVQPGNTNEIAAALLSLLESRDRRLAIAEAGREAISNTYGLPAVAARLDGLYRRVADNRKEAADNRDRR